MPAHLKEKGISMLKSANSQASGNSEYSCLRQGVSVLCSFGPRLKLTAGCLLAIASLLQFAPIASLAASDAPRGSLHIEREVVLSAGHSISPNIIVRAPDGGYIVAGGDNESNTEAWAIKVSSEGKTVWEYLDGTPESWADHKSGINQFHGAVVLADGSTLLCGVKEINRRSFGLLTHIGLHGEVIDQQYLNPRGDQSYRSSIRRCLRWGDGVVLLGRAFIPTVPGAGWLVRLEQSGKVAWETTDEEASSADDALELPDGDLVVCAWSPAARLVRLNSKGEVVARHPLSGEATFMRPLFKSSTMRIAMSDIDSGAKSFLEFDTDLHEISHSQHSEQLGITRGYELPDHSLILFGAINDRGGTASVGRMELGSTLKNYPLLPLHQSGVVKDAVPTGKPHEYALVRISVTPVPGSPQFKAQNQIVMHQGLLTWVTLN
jgi:hypothetical protein